MGPTLNLHGITAVPAGKVAAVITFLQMLAPVRLPVPERPDLSLRRLAHDDTQLYRTVFDSVGSEWLWFSRAVMSDAQLRAILNSPVTEVRILHDASGPIGLAEIDRAQPGEAKIAFFGVVRHAQGSGAAQFLMRRTLHDIFASGEERVWLHTCTFDHPAAIRFYVSEGFVAYRTAIEIADDPRLLGLVPREAAAHIPVIVSADEP